MKNLKHFYLTLMLIPPKPHILLLTALEHKRNENKDEIKVLEEAIEISEKKRS